MKLDYWLNEATGTFPRGVRERLAQEYGAHLADSLLAGGTTDAFELFGDPGKVRKALGKSYIEQKQLTALRQQPKWPYWTLLGAALFPSVMSLGTSLRPAIITCLVAIVFACVWQLTKRLPFERKMVLRNVSGFVIAELAITLPQLFAPLSLMVGKITGVTSVVGLLVCIVGSVSQDQRVRRTIELEQDSRKQ